MVKRWLGEEALKYVEKGRSLGKFGRNVWKLNIAKYAIEKGIKVDEEFVKKLFLLYKELARLYHEYHGTGYVVE